MFKNSYQNGLLTIFYSCGANPLQIWDMSVSNGHIKRLTDNEVNSVVLEIASTNVATTYITCPKDPNQVLGIKLPFLVMIIKNLKRYFSFEITVLDDKHMRRRFRISNFQSTTKIKPFCTTMPIGLARGWNQIQFNLADFTKRAYGSQFLETLRVQVHANARLRRIYFSEKLYSEEELPQDYKLYLPIERKQKKVKVERVLPVKPATTKKGGATTLPAGEKASEPEGAPAAAVTAPAAAPEVTAPKIEAAPSEATASEAAGDVKKAKESPEGLESEKLGESEAGTKNKAGPESEGGGESEAATTDVADEAESEATTGTGAPTDTPKEPTAEDTEEKAAEG